MVTVANGVTQLPLPPHYPTLVYNRNVLLAKPVQIRDTEQLQMQPETAKQSFGCRGGGGKPERDRERQSEVNMRSLRVSAY